MRRRVLAYKCIVPPPQQNQPEPPPLKSNEQEAADVMASSMAYFMVSEGAGAYMLTSARQAH
jgi:hypothetical protein